MMINKTAYRSCLNDKHLQSILRVSSTQDFTPNLNNLVTKTRCQASKLQTAGIEANDVELFEIVFSSLLILQTCILFIANFFAWREIALVFVVQITDKLKMWQFWHSHSS